VAPGLAVFLAGCPIPPDFPVDAGPDSGVVIDAGVDAGGVTGSAGATLTTSSSASSVSLAWNGSDLAATSIDAEGSTGPSQVTISASNSSSGSFKLTLGSLVPGETSENVLSVSYQPASGPDSWTCNTTSNCVGQVTLSSYDGSTIIGTFALTFPEDTFARSAELSNGSFDVTLP
jgi:hypothetical protein